MEFFALLVFVKLLELVSAFRPKPVYEVLYVLVVVVLAFAFILDGSLFLGYFLLAFAVFWSIVTYFRFRPWLGADKQEQNNSKKDASNDTYNENDS